MASKITVKITDGEKILLDKLMLEDGKESTYQYFGMMITELTACRRDHTRRPVGRPGSAAESEDDAPDPNIFIHAQVLPLHEGPHKYDFIGPPVNKALIKHYFESKNQPMPPDYFTNPEYRHPKPEL